MLKDKCYYKYSYKMDKTGDVEKVECKDHSYAWSGSIPCTGIKKCIYCGKIEKKD